MYTICYPIPREYRSQDKVLGIRLLVTLFLDTFLYVRHYDTVTGE